MKNTICRNRTINNSGDRKMTYAPRPGLEFHFGFHLNNDIFGITVVVTSRTVGTAVKEECDDSSSLEDTMYPL